MAGSSPLSRGIRNPGQRDLAGIGIIPALAGNTDHSSRPCRDPWDHPRSRGEYAARATLPMPWWGSSPLSRGILQPFEGGSVRRGIIPALAGNTRTRTLPYDLPKDHPRSRGEYPLVRCLAGHVTRIIPALAGNTIHQIIGCRRPQDHPRSRGEYYTGLLRHPMKRGSSPLSRGILLTFPVLLCRLRIIPALAGNTLD